MNNKEIKWEIKEVAPGMVELNISSFGRIPTREEFKEKAKELLNCKEERTNFEKLGDENYSPDFAENLLLKRELQDRSNEENNSNKIFQVVIPIESGKVTVNAKNIDSILSNGSKPRKLPNGFGANQNLAEEALENLER